MTKITRKDSANTPKTQDRAADQARRHAEARRQAEAARQAAEAQARARSLASGFERGRRHGDTNRLLGGADAASLQQTASALAAESAFAKLAQRPDAKGALEKLGIRDGASLQGFGIRLAREATMGGPTRGADVPLAQVARQTSPQAFAEIVKAAASTVDGSLGAMLAHPQFAQRVAAGESPKAAVDNLGAGQKPTAAALAKLGLTEADLKAAGKDALPVLSEAGKRALEGDFAGAIEALAGLDAAAAPLVEKAVAHLAAQLPAGPARRLLSDPQLVHELVTNPEVRAALGKLARGDLAGAARDLADTAALRDRLVELIAGEPTVEVQLEKLGLSVADLKLAGAALPDLLDAAQAAASGDTRAALGHLVAAAKDASILAERAILHNAKRLPEGLAKSLLTDPALVHDLVSDPALHSALGQLVSSDPKAALETLAADTRLIGSVIDVVARQPKMKAGLATLGMTADDLKAAGKGLPALLEAAELAGKGDLPAAAAKLGEAAKEAAPVIEKAVLHLAKKLPEGVARTLLTDPKVVSELVRNPELHAAFGELAKGDGLGALEGLLDNATIRDRVLDLVAGNARVAAGLSALGLSAADLRSAGAGLPRLIEAAGHAADGDPKAALEALAEAAEQASPAIEKAIVHLAGKLPEGPGRALLTDAKVVHDLVTDPNLRASLKQLVSGEVSAGVQSLLDNATVRDHVIEALASDPSIQKLTDKLGLSVDDLKTAGAALPHLFAAADAAARGDTKAALASLREAAKTSVPLAEKAVKGLAAKLPQTGAAGILRSALTDEQVVRDLLTDPNLHSAIGKLVDGDLAGAIGSLGKARNVRDHLIDALAKNPTVAAGLQKIGLSATDLKQAGDALPELFGAVQDAAAGELQLALRHLGEAAKKAPSLVEKAIIAVASKLPDEGPAGMAKALFTDPAFVSTIVEDKGVHQAFQRMVGGDFTEGLGELLGNEVIRGKVAEILASNPTIKKVLAPLGITSAKDIAAIGAALPTVMELASDIKGGRVGEAFQDLGQILGELPPELRSRMVGNLADKLKLPTWAKDVAVTVAGLLGNEEVARSFAEAVEAFQRGDVKGFVAGLADTAQTIATTNPELAKSFLNSLSRLPGSFGRLFASPELNEMVVDSGSVEHVFAAAKRLAEGDVGGAMEELGNSLKDLLSAGKPIKVAGKELPIGEDGLKALGLMFERFIDALPDKVKAKIAEATAKMAAKVGLSAVPVIGDIIGGGVDAWDLVQAIKNGESGFDIAMAASKVALDVAGAFQVVKPFTVPLKMAIGAAQVVKTTTDVVESVQEFQEEFAGLAA